MTVEAPPLPTTAQIEADLARIEGLDCWRRRLFVKHQVAAQFPRFFYKFFAADPNEADSIRNLRTVFVESRFWLADHRTFNDPFDFKAQVIFQGTRAEKEVRFKKLIANIAHPPSHKERRQALEQMMARPDADMTAQLNEIFVRRAEDIGVCSFATDAKPFPGNKQGAMPAETSTKRSGPRSILMWAHYGRSNEGVCLQFETIKSMRIFSYMQEVRYSDEYPLVNYVNDFQNSLFVPLTRKHKGWEYEKEWRLLHMTGARTLLSFPAAALRRVIFGCRAPEKVYRLVNDLVVERATRGHPPVRLFRAAQHPNQYKLMIWSLRERS
ncbi:MAG: DUF2971 domain-containing protein [Burkholderiales bacterium]|nr:DUF2971 domain-containing protein [Burkholderiales bacterium]